MHCQKNLPVCKCEDLQYRMNFHLVYTYGEGEGRVYESDEDPLDLYSPVEGKIEIKIR